MNLAINGNTYHVDMEGEGFPLVLLHGFTGDSKTWNPFFKEWGKNRKVIVIDILGHGQSDSPKDFKRYEILSVAKDMKQILELLKIEKTDILGYSMGGRLALTFAIQYPLFVRKLVLESSSPGLITEQERANRRMQDRKLCALIQKNGIEKFVEYWENISLFASQRGLPIHKQEEIREQRLQNSVIGLCNSLIGMGTGAQPSWWSHLHKLEADTLLVTGGLDQKFCFIAEEMAKEIKNVEWVKVDGCGHANHVEEPEKFGIIVDRFLESF
jgi:2-succinyl-6-hydroxy-2,4-cyclohexadiene-1-carboxylate synthase